MANRVDGDREHAVGRMLHEIDPPRNVDLTPQGTVMPNDGQVQGDMYGFQQLIIANARFIYGDIATAGGQRGVYGIVNAPTVVLRSVIRSTQPVFTACLFYKIEDSAASYLAVTGEESTSVHAKLVSLLGLTASRVDHVIQSRTAQP